MKLFLTVFLAGLFITGFSGCALFQAAEYEEESEETTITEEGVVKEESVTEEGVVEQTKEEKAEQYLKEERERMELMRQKNEYLIQEYIQTVQEKIKEGQFNQAEETILKALELDEAHPQALSLFYEIERILGKRIEGAEGVRKILADRTILRIEAQKLKAEEALARGKEYLAEGKLDKAIESFEEAQNIINWNPYLKQQAHFEEIKKEVSVLLADTREKKEEADREEEEQKTRKAYELLRKEEELAKIRERKRVSALMEEAIDRFIHEEYEEAEKIAQNVLEIQPFNSEAKGMVEDARKARHDQVEEEYLNIRRDHYRNWLLEIKETTVPYADVLTWPDKKYWDKITRAREKVGVGEPTAEVSEEIQAIKNILQGQKMNLEFSEVPFKEVIEYIRAFSGLNIVIDPEVDSELESSGINVSLKLYNVSIETALRLLLPLGSTEESQLAYTFRENILYITKREKAMGKAVPRLHDVNDLINSLVDFSGPKLELPIGAEEMDTSIFGQVGEGKTIHTSEDLLDLIKQNVAPETWEIEGFSIDTTGGNLLVVNTLEVNKEIENFLNELRRFIGSVVTVETRFITVQQDFLQEIGVDFRGLGLQKGTIANLDDVTNGLWDMASAGFDNQGQGFPTDADISPSSGLFYEKGKQELRGRSENIFDEDLGNRLSSQGGLSLQWTILGDADVAMIVRAVEKTNKANLLTAPILTASNTQRATVTMVSQTSYIKDFDVEVAQTAFIADPVIGTIQDGFALDVRPTISNDRKYVTLEVQPTVATILKPIPTFSTSLSGTSTPVTIQMPELRISRAQTTIKVPDGGSVMIGGLKRIQQVDRKSGIPLFSEIPLVGSVFSRKGKSEEIEDLIIVVTIHVTDLEEQVTSRI